MKMTALALGGVAALAAATMSSPVSAATATRNYFSHAVASCQSALPAFDVNLRKRPQGIRNLGPGGSFVTCDSEQLNNLGASLTQLAVYFNNVSGADGVTVSCTLVDGVYDLTFGVGFIPKTSAPMAAGAFGGSISWTTADNGSSNYTAPAVSCLLPQGVELSAYQTVLIEDVGA